MNTIDLHIVAFNIPYPPNYGGVIDVFYRIKALAEQGIKIHLHCFEYNRPAHQKLNDYCTSLSIYPRKMGWLPHLSPRPYIVQSRRFPTLLARLLEDDAPILFEGIHCTGYLDHPALKHRKKIVRAHNIEWQYYQNLQQLEKTLIPKWYAALEWRKLIPWDKKMTFADQIIAISDRDQTYYQKINKQTVLVYPFHGNQRNSFDQDMEEYILFHGDLSVGDNVAVAQFLIDVFTADQQYSLVIAGRAPKQELKQRIAQLDQVQLFANPDHEEMSQLIKRAKVNVLWSFQTAGMKLKLVNALFHGRFIVANQHILNGTPVRDFCLEANDPKSLKLQVGQAMQRDWTIEVHEERQAMLVRFFDDQKNAAKIIEMIRFKH